MKDCQHTVEKGLPRRGEAITTFLIFIANIITDILVCWDYYKNWRENAYNESNVFAIFIIGAILISNIFQINSIFGLYRDTTSSLLQQFKSTKCHFLFIFFYCIGCMIGLSQPLFLFVIWKLNKVSTNINWYIFRELNIISAIYQSSIGGTLQIYLLISEKQYNNSLIIISIIISVLSYSLNICTKYKPLITTDYNNKRRISYNHRANIKMGPMPFYTFYLFYISIVCDYLIRSIMLSLSLNLMINKGRNTTNFYVLWTFFIIPYLIIYVLYFLRVYFEYQVKFNWLEKVFKFNKDLSDLKDIRNFYVFKAIYYPILTLIRGCNSGWIFILYCDPKQITKSFIKKCVKNQREADELKVDVINNWSYLKDPIYALCRINLLEIIVKYIFNIIIFIIVSTIIINDDVDENNDNFVSWIVVLCFVIIIFIISFWCWIQIIWEYPLIHDYVFIDNISIESIKQEINIKQEVELSPIKQTKNHNDSQWKE